MATSVFAEFLIKIVLPTSDFSILSCVTCVQRSLTDVTRSFQRDPNFDKVTLGALMILNSPIFTAYGHISRAGFI